MKVDIQKVNSYEEEQALLRVVKVTESIQTAVNALENSDPAITARSNGETLLCPIDKIYYIESVDKRTFVYTKDNCLEVQYRLYELENTLSRNFFRAAKAMIINLSSKVLFPAPLPTTAIKSPFSASKEMSQIPLCVPS